MFKAAYSKNYSENTVGILLACGCLAGVLL